MECKRCEGEKTIYDESSGRDFNCPDCEGLGYIVDEDDERIGGLR